MYRPQSIRWLTEQGCDVESALAAEAKELIRLCETGRLYEVEAWIRAGKSLTVPKEVRKTPLTVAMSTGFHSLVELLLRHEASQEVKNDALRQALFLNKPAFIELAVAHGADIGSFPFLDVLMTGNRAVVASFLERGADPIADYPFARAFHELRAKTTLGSYLDCRRIGLTLQTAAVSGRHGAAPVLPGGQSEVGQPVDVGRSEPAFARACSRRRRPHRGPRVAHAALHEACASGNVEILKRLKPNRTDDLAGMLERAAFSAHRDILAYLLDLGANPNDRADGGSSALEACIQHLGWEDFSRNHEYGANYKTPGNKVSRGREAIKLLLKHGAMWKPELSTLNKTRRILYKIEPEVTVELIGLLLNHENGEDAVRELLRVPRMRQHVASCEGQLSRLGITLDGVVALMSALRRRHPLTSSPSTIASDSTKRSGRSRRRRWRGGTGSPMWLCRRSAGSFRFRSLPRGYWAKKQSRSARSTSSETAHAAPFDSLNAFRRDHA